VWWLIGGLVAFLGFFAIVGAVFGGSSADNDSPTTSTPARATVEEPVDNGDWAILACHDSIENQMKDPDSADYKNETATRGTGQNYTVSGMVNGANSYGGMTGFTAYTCTASLDADGETMRATANILE
jgi:hypothetical protein